MLIDGMVNLLRASSIKIWNIPFLEFSIFIFDEILLLFSDNVALVKAVLCAGLYPNVAKVWSPPKKHR